MSTPHTASSSYQKIYQITKKHHGYRYIVAILLLLVLVLFLPWTQNVRSTGRVTTLRQEQRPQNINAIIGGRIVRWYVKEGDFVKAGDTILQLTEIKDDYLDPQLLDRTKEQIDAKQQSIEFYTGKNDALQQQYLALQEGMRLKRQQIENKQQQQLLKIRSDSATLMAANNDYQIAQKQYQRQKELFDEGLVSLTQLEQRNMTLQTAQAKQMSAQNNYNNSRQELTILQLEYAQILQDYTDKISKVQSEQMQTRSTQAGSQGENAKLRNQYANYSKRQAWYYIIAPQDGQMVQAKRSGIGEIVKEGETLLQIVPPFNDPAVEIFVDPLDAPLLNTQQKVRIVFDGFPAIVFSGWPRASYGTFGGKIYTVENNVSPEGKYRVLVKPDSADRPWPKELRLGGGTQGIALLNEVPIWYELWRNINGFPADYYHPEIHDKKK